MTRCAGLRLRLLIGLSALSLLASLQARAGGQAVVLRYPMQEASGDQRYAYYWQLLQAALDVTEYEPTDTFPAGERDTVVGRELPVGTPHIATCRSHSAAS